MKMISIYRSKDNRAIHFKLGDKFYKSSINDTISKMTFSAQFWPSDEQKELLKHEACTAALGCMMPLTDEEVKRLYWAEKRVAYAK